MEPEAVKQLLAAELADCDIQVQGDGSHFDLLLVGECFAGLNPVKKQQLVYRVLGDKIADGSIHAVNMKLYTPDEWAARQG